MKATPNVVGEPPGCAASDCTEPRLFGTRCTTADSACGFDTLELAAASAGGGSTDPRRASPVAAAWAAVPARLPRRRRRGAALAARRLLPLRVRLWVRRFDLWRVRGRRFGLLRDLRDAALAWLAPNAMLVKSSSLSLAKDIPSTSPRLSRMSNADPPSTTVWSAGFRTFTFTGDTKRRAFVAGFEARVPPLVWGRRGSGAPVP